MPVRADGKWQSPAIRLHDLPAYVSPGLGKQTWTDASSGGAYGDVSFWSVPRTGLFTAFPSHLSPEDMKAPQYRGYTIDYDKLDFVGRLGDEELIVRTAPELRLSGKEENLPAAVDYWLTNAKLTYDGQDVLNPIEDSAHLAGATAVNGSAPTWPPDATEDSHPERDDKWNMALINDAARRGNPDSAVAYVHVRAVDNPTYAEIQWWFFYCYNGKEPSLIQYLPKPAVDRVVDRLSEDARQTLMGNHETDWEQVTVRTTPSGQVLCVYGSAHSDEDGWYFPRDEKDSQDGWAVAADDDGGMHPIMYSAFASHANYPTAGIRSRFYVDALRLSTGAAAAAAAVAATTVVGLALVIPAAAVAAGAVAVGNGLSWVLGKKTYVTVLWEEADDGGIHWQLWKRHPTTDARRWVSLDRMDWREPKNAWTRFLGYHIRPPYYHGAYGAPELVNGSAMGGTDDLSKIAGASPELAEALEALLGI